MLNRSATLLLLLVSFTQESRAEEFTGLPWPLTVERDRAQQIQEKILDPILGPGRSSVFVKMRIAVSREAITSSESGVGSRLNPTSGPVDTSTAPAVAESMGTRTHQSATRAEQT